MFESWGAPKAPKNENGPKLDENGDVVWEQPDMTGIGEPTQERPQFVEGRETLQADEEGIAWEQPDMTGVGAPTQERTPVTQDAYTAMDAVEFDPDKVTEKPDGVWEDPLSNKDVGKMHWDDRRAA